MASLEHNITLARKAYLELEMQDCLTILTESPNPEYRAKAQVELTKLQEQLLEVEEWLVMYDRAESTIH